MSDEIIGILQKVKAPCLRCNKAVSAFLIPDGRFICPNCDPRAVYDRWNREWEPHERAFKEKQRAETAAAKMDEAELRKQRLDEKKKKDVAAQQAAAESTARKRAAANEAIKDNRETIDEVFRRVRNESPLETASKPNPYFEVNLIIAIVWGVLLAGLIGNLVKQHIAYEDLRSLISSSYYVDDSAQTLSLDKELVALGHSFWIWCVSFVIVTAGCAVWYVAQRHLISIDTKLKELTLRTQPSTPHIPETPAISAADAWAQSQSRAQNSAK